jgi:hypothetical protein
MIITTGFTVIVGLTCLALGAGICYLLTRDWTITPGSADPDDPGTWPADRARCTQDPHTTDHAHFGDSRSPQGQDIMPWDGPRPGDKLYSWARYPVPPVPLLDGWLVDRLMRTDRWATAFQAGIAYWHDQAQADYMAWIPGGTW